MIGGYLFISKCYGIFLFENKQVVGKLIFALIYALYVDNTWQFSTESFVVLVQKWKRKNKNQDEGVPRRYVKVVFCQLFQFKKK